MQGVTPRIYFMTLQKYLFLLSNIYFSIMFSAAQVVATESISVPDSTSSLVFTPNQLPLTDSIINYGRLFLNTPYRYGASGSASFDCSGFTSYVYRNFGYNLKRSSSEQAQQFEKVELHELQKGDLVYFSGRRNGKSVGHVGIVTEPRENGAFDFIHAAVHKGVTVSKSEEKYYADRFVKANRVIGYNPLLSFVAKSESLSVNQNDEIIAPIAAPVKQIKKTIPAKYHRVKSGETLSEIAEKYGLSIKELKRKNNLRSSKIGVKQQLKVKDAETVLVAEPIIAIETVNKKLKDTILIENVASESSTIETKTHRVKKGESLFSISKKYQISIDELKAINKLESGKIIPGQEIKLSVDVETNNELTTQTLASVDVITHKVKSGETLTSISKKYNVTVEDIKKWNQLVGTNLLPNQELKISESAVVDNLSSSEMPLKTTKYKVKKGESLFSISKKFNVKIDELKAVNNLSSSEIAIGQELLVSVNSKNTAKQGSQLTHKVKSGESFYSLAKKYGCSVNEIKEWNSKSGDKLNIGDKIIIQTK